MKPGGWVELNEFHLRLFSDDGSLKPEMYISKFYDLIGDAAAQAGTLTLFPNLKVDVLILCDG